MTVSIIVPVLNEASVLPDLLEHLAAFADWAEIICVDGGSTDGTAARLQSCPFLHFLSAPTGRARQMNAGAQAAIGDTLLFLHADSRLPPDALEAIDQVLRDPAVVGGRFDATIDGSGWRFTITSWLMNLRSRLTGIATGDQAIFVRRSVFERLGSYPDIPLMEDVEFCRRLRAEGHLAYLTQKVTTSARRWERNGFWRTVFLMWTLGLLNYFGVPPARLAAWYSQVR